jgi:hypothetical protein
VDLNLTFAGLPGRRVYSTTVSLVTDEQGPCRYDVVVRGEIEQEFVLEPEILQFGILGKSESKSLETRVRRADGQAFKIKEIKTSRPELSFTWKPLEDGKETAHSISAVAKALRPGAVVETVTVLTDRPVETSPLLSIAFEVENTVLVTPSIVTANVAADGKLGLFETIVEARDPGQSAMVTEVREGRNLPVEFETEPVVNGRLKIRIRIAGGVPPDVSVGEFLLRTSTQQEPVRLPYRIESPIPRIPGKP